MKDDCFTNYFMILVVVLFFMLVYIYIGSIYVAPVSSSASKNESFNNNDKELLDRNKLLVIQGNTIPDRGSKKIDFDQNDPSFQSVDGTNKTPKSMFMFAFNKCSPDCCGSSPYNCQGGCVCMTNNQSNFISARGHNNRNNKCIPNEY